MQWLELRIPPPVVGALVAAAMWIASRASGGMGGAGGWRLALAILLFVLGVGLALAGSAAFHRAKTTINPLKPEAASSLVVAGVYRFTRNPMYLGLAIALLGWAVYLAAPAALLGPLLFAAYITRFQIVPEERALAKKFGPEFAAYRAKVRRWF